MNIPLSLLNFRTQTFYSWQVRAVYTGLNVSYILERVTCSPSHSGAPDDFHCKEDSPSAE
jgi:hypothetical protein